MLVDYVELLLFYQSHFLISNFRYKMDSYHKGDDQGPNFERLRIDIQHLCLDKVKA